MGLLKERDGATRKNSLIATGATILIVIVLLGIMGARSQYYRNQEWHGVLVEKDRSYDWWRAISQFSDNSTRRRHNYTYYWVIEKPDGSELQVTVPRGAHDVPLGSPIRKRKGERYPIVDTPEAEQRRQERDEAVQMLWDTVLQRDE